MPAPSRKMRTSRRWGRSSARDMRRLCLIDGWLAQTCRAFPISATCMTLSSAPRLAISCILLLTLTFCAGDPAPKQEPHGGVAPNEILERARARNLVELHAVASGVVCDLRYATS